MLKRIICICFLLTGIFNLFGNTANYAPPLWGWRDPRANTFYEYSVDLRDLKDDQLKIELNIKPIPQNEVVFCLPKIVPGIYGAMNFGQNLQNFKAYDDLGKSLTVEKLDVNRWKISGEGLRKITYSINDGWEQFNQFKDGFYLSAESSFHENKAFVINHNTLFGYLKGYENKGIYIQVKKPSGFYGATSLNQIRKPAYLSDTMDLYIADDYHTLVDNPILYSLPDTTNFTVGETEVTVAMYSTTGKKLSAEISEHIKPLLENQKAYLGGKLPVDHYTFILYHHENPDQNSSIGDGLEHSNSTLILMYMPLNLDMIKRNVYWIASHEFFHTLIPLGLHSHEIENYDFNEPKLSRHIWMYEGTTEYFTMHMPIVQKVENLDDFLLKIQNKINQMNQFSNEKSLTYLSTNALENQKDYYNFYLKGALVNLCLDIRLRELSKGKYGIQDLISGLMEIYGEKNPFNDEALFDIIVQTSEQPRLNSFFKSYVEGTEPLPLKSYLAKVGIDYDSKTAKISWTQKPSKAQLKLRKAWIGQ